MVIKLLIFTLFSFVTNRFHVAVRLFFIRSQMTSNCGENKEVAHEPQASVSLMFSPRFDFFCDPLLTSLMATWNLFFLGGGGGMKRDEKLHMHVYLPRTTTLLEDTFVLVYAFSKLQTPPFVPAYFLLQLICIQFIWKVFQSLPFLKAEQSRKHFQNCVFG